MTGDPDQKLKALFGPSDRGVDRAFVNIVDQHVLLEQRLGRARRLAWRKFWRDLLVSGVVLGVLLVLAGLRMGTPAASGPAVPTTFVLFIFMLWGAATLRPAYARL